MSSAIITLPRLQRAAWQVQSWLAELTLIALFWALVVFIGLLAPLALELIEALRGLRPTLMEPALILVGGLSLRWIPVRAGQAA